MFSSLNVMEEADYTFYTSFQDHQYKVISHYRLPPRSQSIIFCCFSFFHNSFSAVVLCFKSGKGVFVILINDV